MPEERNSVGYKLKRARINKKLSLEDARRKTKIHINVLRDIEEDRLKNLNLIYVKGFLKIYAQYLGLDSQKIIEQYQSGISPEQTTDVLEEKDQMPKGNIRTDTSSSKSRKIPKAFKLFIIIFIVFLLGRMILSPKKEKVAPVATKPEVVVQGSSVFPIKKSDSLKLAVRVNADCWLQVVCDGKKIYEGILKNGMKESWNAKEKIIFSVGNAGGIEVEINDEIVPSLGKNGEVLKNLTITRNGMSMVESRR